VGQALGLRAALSRASQLRDAALSRSNPETEPPHASARVLQAIAPALLTSEHLLVGRAPGLRAAPSRASRLPLSRGNPETEPPHVSGLRSGKPAHP